MKDADPDPPRSPHLDPALRRRARLVFATFVAIDLVLVVVYLGNRGGIADGASAILFGASMLAGIGIILFAMEPFRRAELRDNLGQEPVPLGSSVWLPAIGLLVPTAVIWHYALGEPWRAALGRAAGIVGYFGVFVPLARLQRRGVKPYWRPAGYGFLLAGATGGLVWALVAGRNPLEGVLQGAIYSALLYGYVRWATRSAAIRPAEQPSGADAPRA